MFPLPLNIWFEIVSFIVSILCLTSIRDKPLRWFIPFLFLIVVVELTGRYLRTEMHLVNSWLYNIFIPVEYLFYTYIFYSHFKELFLKVTAKALLIIIPIASLLNIILIQGFYNFNTNIIIAGNCIMIFLSCAYFIDLFKREEEITLLNEPMFWISIGILLFNVGELSYTLFFDYILKNRQDAKSIVFTTINSKLIYVLYTCISIGLLCTKTQLTKTYRRK